MDQTPPTEALDARRRRLLFRATHRGTRENDILVGGFVAAGIAGFSDDELAALEAIMELPDPAVADWLTGRAAMPEMEGGAMLRIMRAAALRRSEGLLF
jgi:antitoxin CptB